MINKAVGSESDGPNAEARPDDPQGTNASAPAVGDAVSGETMQLVPRMRTAVDLPTVLEGNYDRENEIARGGMGRIVAAWDRRLGRAVAIKELIHSTDDLRRRFEREAVMTARLEHPAIINVHEAGRWPSGEPFYAMKRVMGESLGDVINKATSLNERLALLPNLISIVEAMAYAHGQNVIHRDLKPANVLLGSFGETVVIDWGLAKDVSAAPDSSEDVARGAVVQEGLTVTGTVMGTPAYMPPEQARGNVVDQRADVYALGAILYYLLAGEPPYTGQSSADVLKRVLDSAPKPLEERQSGVSHDLLTIVRKAMAREANDRYPTARELAEDLKRFQTGQLVGAHAYTSRELLTRWLTRHRTPVSITTIAALILVATGILAFQRIARERNDAQSARRESEARNDELVLNQARNSLKEDPTAAIAWLKKYSLDAPAWGAARMIAADARSQGVATKVLAGHEHQVHRVVFSPDGKRIASASADRTVRIWNLADGSSRVLKGHDWFVHALAFSPDGRWLASAGGTMLWAWNVATGEGRSVRGRFMDTQIVYAPDGRSVVSLAEDDDGLFIHLWDPQTGFARTLRDSSGLRGRFELPNTGRFQLSISPDGATLLAQTGDETLRAWDMKTGRGRKLTSQRTFALSGDGHLLATVGRANAVGLRDLETGKDRILPGVSGPVSALAFSPDRQWIASGGEDSRVRVWNVRTGKVRILTSSSGEVVRIAFSPDNKILASFTDDRTVRLWDVASGDCRVLRGHLDPIEDIAFSPDGQQIASASVDRTIRLWPLGTDDQHLLFRPDTAPDSPTPKIAFGPKGHRLAAAWDGASIHLWDLETDLHRVLTGHDGTIHRSRTPASEILQMVFSPDGASLASAGSDKTVRLWNVATGDSRTFAGHERDVEDVTFSPDGARLASVSLDRMVRLWDIAKGTSAVLAGHQFPLAHVAFSPDGRWLASSAWPARRDSGQQDLTVRLWDTQTGVGRELPGHEDTVTDVRFSTDGRTIASGSMDTTVRVWDLASGRVQTVLKGDGSIVNDIVLSRDGRWLASGNNGGFTRLWNLMTGQNRLVKGQAPAFSQDGATLATSAQPGGDVARLWDTATGEGRALPDAYSNVAISPDGKLVAAIGKDGAVHLWNDDLPRDPAALKAWLQKATEYKVSAGSPGLTQPDRP